MCLYFQGICECTNSMKHTETWVNKALRWFFTWLSYFFSWKILLYNVLVVFAIYKHESVIIIYIYTHTHTPMCIYVCICTWREKELTVSNWLMSQWGWQVYYLQAGQHAGHLRGSWCCKSCPKPRSRIAYSLFLFNEDIIIRPAHMNK